MPIKSHQQDRLIKLNKNNRCAKEDREIPPALNPRWNSKQLRKAETCCRVGEVILHLPHSSHGKQSHDALTVEPLLRYTFHRLTHPNTCLPEKVFTCACVCLFLSQRAIWGAVPQMSCTLFLNTAWNLLSRLRLVWPKSLKGLCLCLPSTGTSSEWTMCALLGGFWGLDSDLHTWRQTLYQLSYLPSLFTFQASGGSHPSPLDTSTL